LSLYLKNNTKNGMLCQKLNNKAVKILFKVV
jgi:hypothetical protein